MLKQIWVFGGIERVSKKFFVLPLVQGENVLKKNKETLIPLIQKYILPKSVIFSDSFATYNSLNELGYTHYQVNHSENFVDPIDRNIHTQNIERLWRDLKESIKRPGIKTKYLYQYIARYMFMKSEKSHADRLHKFLIYAGKLYPHKSTKQRREVADLDGSSDEEEGPQPSTSH